MNKGMWKRNLKRGAVLAPTLATSLSIAARGVVQERLAAQAAGNADVADVTVHEAILYSRKLYGHYDPAIIEQATVDSEQVCAVEDRDEGVLRLYDVTVDRHDRPTILTYMIQLEYDTDVSGEQATSEQAYTTDIYFKMGGKAMACLEKGVNSFYEKVLADKTGIGDAPYIEYYKESTGELTELNRKEQEFLRKYDKPIAGDLMAELEDGQWSYSRLEQKPNLGGGQYVRIEGTLVRGKNRALGNRFQKLVQVCRRIAELKGYDSHTQYSFEAVYGRNYTLQDVEELYADIKTNIVSLNNNIQHMNMAQESYGSSDPMEESSTEDIPACVGRTVQSVNPELGEILRYMQDNKLYDIWSGEDGQGRMDNNYTVGSPSYGDAFISINRNDTFTGYQSLIHEFGHLSSYYYNSVPKLFQGCSVDVCEVQSQGLEILANQYAVDMFNEGAEVFGLESVTDMPYVTIMSCMLQEFREAVYMELDMSLEDMNHTFGKIQNSCRGWYYDIYDEDVCYDWVDVSHSFYNPPYYMGYGTLALSAPDLWTISRSSQDGAVDTYMGLLHEDLDVPHRDTMYRCGPRDVFDSRELESLAGGVRRLQRLEQDSGDFEIPSQEDAGRAGTNLEGRPDSGLGIVGPLVMAGICVVLVFQIMILCIGFTITWPLVRRRREEQ